MKTTKKSDGDSKIIQMHEKHALKQGKLQQKMSYGALFILAIVLVAFVAWPILSTGPGGGASASFGSYRGEPINYSAEYGLFNNTIGNLFDQFSIDNSSNELQRRNVFERAFFSTVNQYGRYFFLRDQGNSVSSKETNTLIYEQFIRDGKFDRIAWNRLQGDPNRLKNVQNIMHYAAAQNIWHDIYGSVDLVSDSELTLLVPTLGDVRKLSYLYHRVADYPETEVEKYYRKNQSLFQKEFLRRIVVDSKPDRNKVQSELEDGSGVFSELAQLYSNDVYSQNEGEYGNKFYYELRDSFALNTEMEEATQWADEIFALQQGEYTGPYEMNKAWFFFQVKTQEEIQAEIESKEKDSEEDAEELQSGLDAVTGFAAVVDTVRGYIERNELSLITAYFRKNMASLKVAAESGLASGELNSLEDLGGFLEGRDVAADYSKTPEYFGFTYSEEDSALYDSLSVAFPEEGLAAALRSSKPFFENIFALEVGELSEVMLLGLDAAAADSEQQYIAFFRLEDVRSSNVNDFARSRGDGLDSKQSLYNYYMDSLLTSSLQLEFLQRKNLKENFESSYQDWAENVSGN